MERHAISIAYRALLPLDSFQLKAGGKRIDILKWCPVREATAEGSVAFDHACLAAQAVAAARGDVERRDPPFGFLPETLTLGELQATCEAILGRARYKANFRRGLEDRHIVEVVPAAMRTGPIRPAQLFRRRTLSD